MNAPQSELKTETPPETVPPSPPDNPMNDSAVQALLQDPIGFVQQIVETEAQKHLYSLKEEAELNGAISSFRKAHPEFDKFRDMILPEVARLIQSDEDGHIAPWTSLLEKALENVKTALAETVKQEVKTMQQNAPQPPFVEGKSNRVQPELPPSFTQEQIRNMSMAEFLKNEAAIDDALRNGRIK